MKWEGSARRQAASATSVMLETRPYGVDDECSGVAMLLWNSKVPDSKMGIWVIVMKLVSDA